MCKLLECSCHLDLLVKAEMPAWVENADPERALHTQGE